jgi:hypothetical protein
MKNFIKTIGFTFYSGYFYNKIKDEKTIGGIEFLFKVSLFITVCLAILGLVLILIFSPLLKSKINEFVATSYPDDLVVNIKDGKMTANIDEPFFIKTPGATENSEVKKNLLVLLPNEKKDASLLSKYDTSLAITSDGIVGEKNEGKEISIINYDDMTFTLDKVKAQKYLNILYYFFTIFFVIGVVPMGMLVLVTMIGFHLTWLFFVALLIWAFLSLKKLNISYKQSYRIGMYSIVPLVFLELIAIPFNLSGSLFTIAIMLTVTLIVTHDWKKEEII